MQVVLVRVSWTIRTRAFSHNRTHAFFVEIHVLVVQYSPTKRFTGFVLLLIRAERENNRPSARSVVASPSRRSSVVGRRSSVVGRRSSLRLRVGRRSSSFASARRELHARARSPQTPNRAGVPIARTADRVETGTIADRDDRRRPRRSVKPTRLVSPRRANGFRVLKTALFFFSLGDVFQILWTVARVARVG